MAPHTRRSKRIAITHNPQLTNADNQVQLDSGTFTRGDVGNIQPQQQTISTATSTTNANANRKKRTIAPSNISTDSAAQVPQIRPPKKARNMGPPRGRPMPLRLISGGERVVASGTSGVGVMSRITAATRSRPTSRRPRHSHSNDDTSVASDSDERVSNAGSYAETEVDSSPEQDMLEDTQSQPSRLHLARPSWKGSTDTSRMSQSSGPEGSSGLLGSTGTPRSSSGSLDFTGTPHASSGSLGPAGTLCSSSGSLDVAGTPYAFSGSLGPAGTPHSSSRSLGFAGTPHTSSGSLSPAGTSRASFGSLGSAGMLSASSGLSGSTGISVADVSNPSAPIQSASNDTDLYLVPGTNKVNLSAQRPLIRVIIQDTIEDVRASLFCDHAFPNATMAVQVIRKSLLDAAEKYKPGASAIHMRLEADHRYMSMMVRLPRPRLPLIRSEVKERCNALVMAAFLTLPSPTEIVKEVAKQLWNYTYTYPKAPNAGGLILRSQPYRNERIITILRELYFAGGTTPFGARFSHRFPKHPGSDGIFRIEMPVAMLALVSTALYASINEWRSGEHRPAEFSANTYLDVYDGHVNTFEHLKATHPAAYHKMMGDLHTQASLSVQNRNQVVPGPRVQIAELDMDELED